MTPQQCAKAFWDMNEHCRQVQYGEAPRDPLAIRQKLDAIAKAQNRFDAFDWTVYSHALRAGATNAPAHGT